jgi:SAM-dependent methyltransferase
MQPYEGYQLITSMEETIRILKEKCVDTINFEQGDTIADIGAGNGSVEAMLSIFHNSLTFYVQDIDTSVCNQKTINEVISFFQGISKKPITNKFIIVSGSDDKTNLPDDTFDKILMLWTYPYFKNPRAIMTDLNQKLKNAGRMYIVNPNLSYESSKILTAEHGWNASPIEEQISDIIECGFELIKISRNNEGPENPYIIVFKKKNN